MARRDSTTDLDVQGWLEDDDPFLAVIDEIVESRSQHAPRILGSAEETRLAEDTYAAAMERFISRPPVPLKSPGERYPSRADLHERGRSR